MCWRYFPPQINCISFAARTSHFQHVLIGISLLVGSNYGLTALTSTRISSMWRDNLVSPLVSWNLDINPLKPTVGYLMCWVALLKRGWSHLLFVDDPIVICGWSNCYSRRIPFVIRGWSHLLFMDDPICYLRMIPFVIPGWSHLLFMDDPICYSWMIIIIIIIIIFFIYPLPA